MSASKKMELLIKFRGLASGEVDEAARTLMSRVVNELHLKVTGPIPLPKYYGKFKNNPKKIDGVSKFSVKAQQIHGRMVKIIGVDSDSVAEMNRWDFPDSLRINIRVRDDHESWKRLRKSKMAST